MDKPPTGRRFDLDWVRVGAFGLLILYHVGMMYVEWGWHIKSTYQSELLENFMTVLNRWRLPLLFLVSGAAIYFVMRKVELGRFFLARSIRLLIPLVFGMFVIVLPQVYYELQTKGVDLTVLEFLKAYYTFDQSYPTYIPTYNHMWFVAYLWVYSILFMPILYALKTERGKKFSGYFNFDWMPNWMVVFGPVAVFTIYWTWIRPYFPSTHALVDDWFNHVVYFTVMIFGYMLAASTKVWNWLSQHRRKLAVTAFTTISIILVLRNIEFQEELPGWVFYVTRPLLTLNMWAWILMILAFAFTYFNKPSKQLTYLNEAVYPFYILHQTLIIMIGYPLSQWGGFNIYVESLTITLLTFAGCFTIYEFGVRRFQFLRFLFGLKISKKPGEAKPPTTEMKPKGVYR